MIASLREIAPSELEAGLDREIVIERPRAQDGVAAWQLRKAAGVRADIVPCRASDFLEDRTTPNTLAFEADTRGRLVHER
jgi:hypothetical protein